MAAFLYIWNPERWNWVDQQEAIYRVANGEEYDIFWSCGNTQKIKIGDVFFLMRLGVPPKGIIGCGYISSEPYTMPHWEEDKAKNNKTALRTDLLFKALAEEPIISQSYLINNYSSYNWSPQVGGLSIPEDISTELFALLQGKPEFSFNPETNDEIRVYSEGKSRKVTLNTYDRSPEARQACIEHYGYNCSVCSFSFGNSYGTLGANYIEVHHLRQIADIGEEYIIHPINDLRPVCANCHRMLHKKRPPLSIEELKSRIGLNTLT